MSAVSIWDAVHSTGAPVLQDPTKETQWTLGILPRGLALDSKSKRLNPPRVSSHSNGDTDNLPWTVNEPIMYIYNNRPPIIPPEIMYVRQFGGLAPAPKVLETNTLLSTYYHTNSDGTPKQRINNPLIRAEKNQMRQFTAENVMFRIQQLQKHGNPQAARNLMQEYQAYLQANPYGPDGPRASPNNHFEQYK